MGYCSSREIKEEIARQQKLKILNDEYFWIDPEIPQLEKEVQQLGHTLQVYQKRLENTSKNIRETQNFPGFPELIIEIQKGENLIQESCCQNEKPFVNVQIKPHGPFFSTVLGASANPVWYKLFQFKHQYTTYTQIVFAVVSLDSSESQQEIGSFIVKIQDLKNQKIVQGWYALQSQSKRKPKLRVKLQYIHDKSALFREILIKQEEIVHIIQKKIEEKKNISPSTS